MFDDSIRDLLGFNARTILEAYTLSPNRVDILSIDNNFMHRDKAQGMIFKCKESGINHNFTMDVDQSYKYIEKFRGGIQWYMMDTKDFVSNISFNLKNEHDELVSFNGQSITFRLSFKEV